MTYNAYVAQKVKLFRRFEDTKKESGLLQIGQKPYLGHSFSQKLASSAKI